MAFVNPASKEQENKFAVSGETTPFPQGEAPPETSGGSAGAGGSGPGAAPTQGTSTQFGSSASKLSDYLSANAPQIEGMSQKVAGDLNTRYGQLKGDVDTASHGFGTAVSGGYAPSNQGLVDQAVANPTEFVKNPNNVTDFQKQMNNSYTGPQNFESYDPYSKVQGDISKASQEAGQLDSYGGLSTYLQNKTTGNYTPGMNTLDTTLLQANPNAVKNVSDAAKPLTGLTDYLNQAATNANQLVNPAKQSAKDSSAYASGKINPYAQQFNTEIQDATTRAETGRQTYNKQLSESQNLSGTNRQNLLGNKQSNLSNLTNYLTGRGGSDVLNQPSSIAAMNEYSADPSMYDAILGQQMNNNSATSANTATAEQYAQANALSQLIGQNYTSPLDQTMVGQAGSYKPQNPLLSQSAADTKAQGQMSRMDDLNLLYTTPVPGVGAVMPTQLPGNASAVQRAQEMLDMQSTGIPEPGGHVRQVAPDMGQVYNDALRRLIGNSYGI